MKQSVSRPRPGRPRFYPAFALIAISAFLLVAVTMGLPLLIRTFAMEAFKVPSGAMSPTLLPGDHFLVDKTYEYPGRWDIIVFKYPRDHKKNFVKRIVAIAGDTIEIRDKVLFINGSAVEESFVRHSDAALLPARISPRDNFGPVNVPEGKCFVLGDNRDDSFDSRFWGFVDQADIKGKAIFIYWSWDGDAGKARFERIGLEL